jgi:hypothetical protein
MNSKRNWKTTWSRATAFVALAAILAVGFTFATVGTASADNIPCAAPAWLTGDSHIPQEAIESACALPSGGSTVAVFTASRTHSFDSWDFYQQYLDAIAQVDSVVNAEFTATTTEFDSWDYYQQYLDAIGQAEN